MYIQNSPSPPQQSDKGSLYLNTSDNTLYIYTDGGWVKFAQSSDKEFTRGREKMVEYIHELIGV